MIVVSTAFAIIQVSHGANFREKTGRPARFEYGFEDNIRFPRFQG